MASQGMQALRILRLNKILPPSLVAVLLQIDFYTAKQSVTDCCKLEGVVSRLSPPACICIAAGGAGGAGRWRAASRCIALHTSWNVAQSACMSARVLLRRRQWRCWTRTAASPCYLRHRAWTLCHETYFQGYELVAQATVAVSNEGGSITVHSACSAEHGCKLEPHTRCTLARRSQVQFCRTTHQGCKSFAQAAVAVPDEGGSITVHSATQSVDAVQRVVASTLGIPFHQVQEWMSHLLS